MKNYKKIESFIFKGDLIATFYNDGDIKIKNIGIKIIKDKKDYAKTKKL